MHYFSDVKWETLEGDGYVKLERYDDEFEGLNVGYPSYRAYC